MILKQPVKWWSVKRIDLIYPVGKKWIKKEKRHEETRQIICDQPGFLCLY